MATKSPTSAQTLRDLTKHVMVDFVQMKNFSADPLIMVEGDGVYLIDDRGQRYMDGLSGVFSVSLGHGNEEIVDAIAAQLRKLAFASPIMTTNDRALELASRLIELAGGRYSVFKQFCSGSEATEAAMKLARQYHRQSGAGERYKTISFYRSYHGGTMGALSATGWPKLRNPYEPLVHGGIHVPPPAPTVCRFCTGGPCSLACLENLRDTIELEGPRTVSAVILEPILLTAGVQMPPREWFVALRELCDETGVLLIFDEIVSGFGRLGHWFAAELLDVWPDLLVFGKGLSSGYVPLSGVLVPPRVAEAFWGEAVENLQFQAGHTFSGNPVSAACGLAVIDYFERHGVLENVAARGAELHARLREIADASPIVGALRGQGLLYCLDLVPTDSPLGTAVQRAARQRGLLVRASPNNTTIAPPLVITAEEVTELTRIYQEALAEVADQVARHGAVDVDVAFGI
jgi:adenosylmethionine-8-amino-7-oxononanoate aminotransferase